MNGPRKRKPPGEAGGGRRAVGCFGGRSQKEITEDRREFQGIANARHSGQSGPVWDEPPGADAARLLAACWRIRRQR
jgi:hypothetical protein